MKLSKGASKIFLISITTLIILVSIFVSQAQTTITKSYDANTKTVTINQGGNKIAELQLIKNTDFCDTNCEAIIKIRATSSLSLPSSQNSNYQWDFVKASQEQSGLESYWFEKETTTSHLVTDYIESCNPYTHDYGNGTTINIPNCTAVATGSHTEYVTKYEPFDFWSETLNANTDYYIKLRGRKQASLRDNKVDWIPTFYGLELNEWAWWNTTYDFKRSDTSGYSGVTQFTNFPYLINTSGFDLGNPNATQFVWTKGSVNGSKWLYYDNNQLYASVNSTENENDPNARDPMEVEVGNSSDYGNLKDLWNSTFNIVHHITRRSSQYNDSSGNGINSNLTNQAYNITGIIGEGVNFKNAPNNGYNELNSLLHTVTIPDNGESLWNSENFTMSFWVNYSKFTDYAKVGMHMAKGGDQSSTGEWHFSTGGCNGVQAVLSFTVTGTDGSNRCVAWWNNGNTPQENKWYHITGVKNGSSVVLYVNGTEVNRTNSVFTRQKNDLLLTFNGKRMTTTSPNRVGWIQSPINATFDEIRYASRELTPDETKAVYESTAWRIRSEKFSDIGTQTNVTLGNANETEGDQAIVDGIIASLGSSAPIYSNRIVYQRNITTSLRFGLFDKVTTFSNATVNKTWAINYVTALESYANLTNITPVFYTLEIADLTSSNINTTVKAFIDGTRG